MGLIQSETPAEEAANALRLEIKGAVMHLKGSLYTCFSRFWQDPGGATPQEILDVFGTNAAALMGVFQNSIALVNSILPEGIVLGESPATVVPNPDGTATVVPNPAPE